MSNNSTVHLAPQIVTQQESAAHIAALEAENARLRVAVGATSPAPGGLAEVDTEWISHATIEELRSLAIAQEYLLVGRGRLLATIPPCPLHGESCVPHALEWVAAQTAQNGGSDGG